MNIATDKIRAEIAERGVVSFARFMELALYCPDCGYYEKENDTIGRRGDFYTSVSVGPLFGELLAFQFAEWMEQRVTMVPERSPFQIVEAGTHDGKLAKDILSWLRQQRPDLLDQIEYQILEPSSRRKRWQEETLQEFAGKVRWFENLRAMAGSVSRPPGITGVIFSNELLDAMPIRRLGWDLQNSRWFEWGVAAENGRFVWARMNDPVKQNDLAILPSTFDEAGLGNLHELQTSLPDGFIVEICPAALAWWHEAAEALRSGKLMTIDYGLNAAEFLTPQRSAGTLRAYREHRVSNDVLANPGEQDLTAHVNFTALQAAGESDGLRTQTHQTQAQFLTDIASRAWNGKNGFGAWTPVRTRQFRTLTHPEHLGRTFRVLVQTK